MKKKILLMLSMVAVLACVFALAVSAESVHSGKVDLNATVTLDDGTVCNLFDSNGNALIWFKNGSELQSIRADDERVRYKATYGFNVGNSTVGVVYAYEVSDMWIALESGNISKGNIVVLNLMDDDVKINEGGSSYIGGVVNCVKGIQWANKILEYAFLRLDTVAIQLQSFNGCDKLKYVNVADLTELRAIGGGNAFGGSKRLFEGQILDLTRTKLCSINGNAAFNYVPLVGIKLPSTLTTMDPWNIQGTAVVSFAFPEGVKTITGSQFNDCKSLTTIYINNTTTKIEDRAFNNTALEKIFFVGSLDELNALLDNTGANNNAPFWDVVGENRANLISYADYLALEDKSGKYVVYNYSYCEAYNNGEHTFAGNAVMQEVDYFKNILFMDTCTVENCGMKMVDDSKTIGAIFIDYGYSVTEEAINGKHSMTQAYGINKEAFDAYVALGHKLEYGLVVSVVTNPLDESQNSLIAEKKTYITEQNFIAHDIFEIGVVGIGEAQTNVALTFCAFIIDNGEVFYLDGGETLIEATAKSHDDLSPKGE
ncbi:MAG: leucine-rich repeat protein [Clostridia bacterium]|nr:leucine-rich repeat protein [Clostridia bacterium]